ncbi:unnamed protein product [Protopolystoma xenopodis]|uniref:Uncharacterized protein n=1 Tax=Protopolystoma xenopodis TaxID=117903 RepID=A0A448XP76_9PLAT|nr:unnamed protein product [Protopolystoma xenopodis]
MHLRALSRLFDGQQAPNEEVICVILVVSWQHLWISAAAKLLYGKTVSTGLTPWIGDKYRSGRQLSLTPYAPVLRDGCRLGNQSISVSYKVASSEA